MIRSKLHIYELSKCVYFLNRHLNDLNERLKVCEPDQRTALQSVSGGLYRLKEKVMIKMLAEGYCTVKNYETQRGAKHYVVSLNPGILVNLTVSSRVRQAVNTFLGESDPIFIRDDRKTMTNLDYDFDDVCGKLNAYLKDEIEICDDPSIMGNVIRKETISFIKDREYTDAEELARAISVINTAVILKFQSNERPHPGWFSVWKKSIAVAEHLVSAGKMQFEGEGFFFRKGYLFYCKIYFIESLGQIVVLDFPYQVLPADCDESQLDGTSLNESYPRMPPVISWSNSAGVRHQSADLIKNFSLNT